MRFDLLHVAFDWECQFAEFKFAIWGWADDALLGISEDWERKIFVLWLFWKPFVIRYGKEG